MKNMVFGSVAMLFLFVVSIANPALAAELLDVKPIITGSNVDIEVTADIPMTYTYYKVPGQPRAVVDIADADPEKIEPLIVINKGAIASISVDKAMIADMTVSRLVFNLMSETDISVKQAADRKTITVLFGGGKSVVPAPAVEPSPAAHPVPVAVVEPVVVATPPPTVVVPEPQKPDAVVATPGNQLSKEEEDPLGLDEPKSVSVPATVPVPAPVVARSVKLEPVVPVTTNTQSSPSKVVVKGIVVGTSFINIQTNGNVDKIKHMKLVQPDRLAIDIPGTSTIKVKTISVNKFGIANVRIGKSPGFVRIVLDATKASFPVYSVDSTENGIRINFK